MSTYGSYSSDKPNTVRLSPDGTKLAYRILYAGDYHVFWTPSDATDTRGFSQNGQSLGQESYGSPSWIGNTDLFLVHNGGTFPNQDEFATYHVGNGDNTLANAGNEPDQSWQNGYHSAITRDGSKVASIQDDGGGSTPTRTELHLFTTNATVPTAVTLACTITLPAQDTFYSSPSFSADGTKLAFALSDGVHIIDVSNLANCPTSAGPVVVAGATMPYLGAGESAGDGDDTAAAAHRRRRRRHRRRHDPPDRIAEVRQGQARDGTGQGPPARAPVRRGVLGQADGDDRPEDGEEARPPGEEEQVEEAGQGRRGDDRHGHR